MPVLNNVFDFKEVWEASYEVSHYLAPVYKAIADESYKGDLYQGKTFHRTAVGDFNINDMDAFGGYQPQQWDEADETLTINFAKEVSVQVKKQDLYMTHLPQMAKRAEKSMNALFRKIDGMVFSTAYQNAGLVVDQSSLTLSSSDVGVPITPSVPNIPNIFALAETALIASNMDYQASGKWTGQFKIDKSMYVPVFVMSSQLYSFLTLYIGGKTTALGDRVSQSGHVGQFFGFNCFVSNALPWSGQIQIPTQPSDGDTVTFLTGVSKNILGVVSSQAITFTFKTVVGATAGNVLIGASAATAAANLQALIAAPYTTTAQGVGWTAPVFGTSTSQLSIMQQAFLTNTTATVDATVNTSVDFIIEGFGNVPVTAVFTSANNAWNANSLMQHNIAGVSRSLSLIMPRMAEIDSRPSPQSRVATDYIAWTYFGMKVYADQAPGLIDVKIATAGFTTTPNIISN